MMLMIHFSASIASWAASFFAPPHPHQALGSPYHIVPLHDHPPYPLIRPGAHPNLPWHLEGFSSPKERGAAPPAADPPPTQAGHPTLPCFTMSFCAWCLKTSFYSVSCAWMGPDSNFACEKIVVFTGFWPRTKGPGRKKIAS